MVANLKCSQLTHLNQIYLAIGDPDISHLSEVLIGGSDRTATKLDYLGLSSYANDHTQSLLITFSRPVYQAENQDRGDRAQEVRL